MKRLKLLVLPKALELLKMLPVVLLAAETGGGAVGGPAVTWRFLRSLVKRGPLRLRRCVTTCSRAFY